MGINPLSDTVVNQFIKTYKEDYQFSNIYEYTEEDMLRFDYVKNKLQRFLQWEWNYGNSPKFIKKMSKSFSWGSVNLSFECEKGRITVKDLKIISPSPILTDTGFTLEELSIDWIQGKLYRYEDLMAYPESLTHHREFMEIISWIVSDI